MKEAHLIGLKLNVLRNDICKVTERNSLFASAVSPEFLIDLALSLVDLHRDVANNRHRLSSEALSLPAYLHQEFFSVDFTVLDVMLNNEISIKI